MLIARGARSLRIIYTRVQIKVLLIINHFNKEKQIEIEDLAASREFGENNSRLKVRNKAMRKNSWQTKSEPRRA